MRKKIALLVAWFPLTLLSLALSFFVLNSYSQLSHIPEGKKLLKAQAMQMLPRSGPEFYASLPEVLGSFTVAIAEGDARPEILRSFLKSHNSPFVEHAQTIVDASDVYDIDFRLITAIAMCESNLGKKMPAGSYNAWGYAIYTGQDSGAEFDNWGHAIKVMAEYLSTKYYSQGLVNPEEIGPIYAPPSVNTGNSWAKCVRSFMDELQ